MPAYNPLPDFVRRTALWAEDQHQTVRDRARLYLDKGYAFSSVLLKDLAEADALLALVRMALGVGGAANAPDEALIKAAGEMRRLAERLVENATLCASNGGEMNSTCAMQRAVGQIGLQAAARLLRDLRSHGG